MLAFLGFLTVIIMLALVMTKKASPTVALIMVPLITGLAGSFITSGEQAYSPVDLGSFITSGISSVAATGVMFIFSILFFGILTDAGTFRPIIGKIVSVVGVDPVRVALGTAILAMIVHLDGSGAVTFLVTVPAMLPLYDHIGMKRTTLAAITALSAGTMNVVPWGGPTIRAATALEVEVGFFFNPMLIPVGAGLATVLVFAFLMGRAEKSRIGNVALQAIGHQEEALDEEKKALLRPRMFVFNVALIIVAIYVLVKSILAPQVVFMIAFCIAVVANYPDVKLQRKLVDIHAKDCLMMASVLFAAGAFTGIMKESGMIAEMASALVSVIPVSMGRFLPAIVGLIAMPASLLFDPDSFYYGVLPILAETAEGFGVEALSVGRAAILGQMTTGFPVSPLTPATFLLVGLTGVDFGDHQKKTIPLAFAVTIVMLAVAVLVGAIGF